MTLYQIFPLLKTMSLGTQSLQTDGRHITDKQWSILLWIAGLPTHPKFVVFETNVKRSNHSYFVYKHNCSQSYIRGPYILSRSLSGLESMESISAANLRLGEEWFANMPVCYSRTVTARGLAFDHRELSRIIYRNRLLLSPVMSEHVRQ